MPDLLNSLKTPIRIAVVEDDKIVREGLQMLLNGSPGFSCVAAYGNGEDALAALACVRTTAAGEDNLLPPMRDALRAHCTIGEICEVLREEWGTHDALIAGGR